MGEKETIEEFQARFLSLVNSLTYLGEEIPNWKLVTRVLQCLNKEWDPIALHFQTQPYTKKFDIDKFFEKLSAFQGLQKRKEEPMEVKNKSHALKVEGALKNMSQDFQRGDDEDSEDKELALITKAVKKFWRMSQPNKNNGPPNVVNIKCYNC